MLNSGPSSLNLRFGNGAGFLCLQRCPYKLSILDWISSLVQLCYVRADKLRQQYAGISENQGVFTCDRLILSVSLSVGLYFCTYALLI